MRADDPSVDWFSSSYSNDQGGQCVQGGRRSDGRMAVRDSKFIEGPAFTFSSEAWAPFIGSLKAAE
ncbi:DUF397 domain-containing protein [Streptomyces sp. NPDC006692]|uniref:DUF397 domain-containing protein n=1 Tax=unclassified Streptomyces TaxID=2593676 RepID=UPI0036A6D2D9